jgi:hypothetical protein
MRLHFSPSSTTLDTLSSCIKASIGNFRHGAVAQSVERSPEKAGVGGSIPPCPTCKSNACWTLLGWLKSPQCPYGVYRSSFLVLLHVRLTPSEIERQT